MHAPHDSHRDAVDLAHHEFCCSRNLIANGEDARLHVIAVGVIDPRITFDGVDACHANGNIDLPFAPGPPKRIRNNHGNGQIGGRTQRITDDAG